MDYAIKILQREMNSLKGEIIRINNVADEEFEGHSNEEAKSAIISIESKIKSLRNSVHALMCNEL